MTFFNAIQVCLSKYATFSGRASRAEYWWFFLFCVLIFLATAVISQTLYAVAAIALFLPSLAVLFRRLHDIDRTAWWLLILFIPFIGQVVIFIFTVLQGSDGSNRFGNPS